MKFVHRWLIGGIGLMLASCGTERGEPENVQPGAGKAGPAAVAETQPGSMPIVTDTQTAPGAGTSAPQP
jgi:hypothetical protein